MKSRVVGLLAMVLVAAVAGRANAQAAKGEDSSAADSEKYIRVLQQKPFFKGVRFELEPTFNVSLNETMTRHIGAGVQARMHIDDQWAIGVDYIKYFGSDSGLGKEVGEAYQVYPEKRLMDFYVGGHVTYSPLQGKFLWFGGVGKPVFWDMYFLAGGGAQKTLWGNWHGSGNFGIGVRFEWLQWLATNVEIRDYMFMENYAHDDKFVNNVVFTAGFAVFVPFKHNYKNPK
jgi:outer membrane beta-barrel protein